MIADSVQDPAYPNTFHTNDEGPASLRDMNSSGLYAWRSQALLPLSAGLGLTTYLHRANTSYGDDIVDVENPATSVDFVRQVSARGFNFNDCSYKQVWLTVDQIYDPHHVLGDSNVAHSRSLVESLYGHYLDYARLMKTLTFCSDVNLEGAAWSEAFTDFWARSPLERLQDCQCR